MTCGAKLPGDRLYRKTSPAIFPWRRDIAWNVSESLHSAASRMDTWYYL